VLVGVDWNRRPSGSRLRSRGGGGSSDSSSSSSSSSSISK